MKAMAMIRNATRAASTIQAPTCLGLVAHGRSLRMQFSKKACQSLYHRRAASDGGWRRGAPDDRAIMESRVSARRALRRSMRTSMTSSTRMPMVRSGNTAFSQIDTSGVDHAQALR